MKKRQELRLRALTVITVLVLAGILLLQVYWLVTSYKEQKERFTADIENALIASNVTTVLTDLIKQSGNEFLEAFDMKDLADQMSSSVNSISPKERHREGHTSLIALQLEQPQIADTQKLLSALRKMIDSNTLFDVKDDAITLKPADTSKKQLKKYQNNFQQELEKRAIRTPFEMAMISGSGNIINATCDSETFSRIPIKTSVKNMGSKLPGTANTWLQVAFPDANLYLLHKMIWLLSVTVLLIIIGSISLTYLLVTFFRQKKIADIRNDFMNNMTHELKTPISAVGVALEMIMDERHAINEVKKKNYLSIAQSELKRLNILVENVLKIVSLERNDIKINKEPIAILPWLMSIYSTFEPILENRNAALHIQVNPDWLVAPADKTHLTNVIQNLLENALKYNDKEQPEITIHAWEDETMIMIRVSDNGQGIPSKYLDKIFDKFFRVPTGDRHDVKGYGLGLSYVKTIADLHHGNITVSSTLSEGSSFIIYLPKLKTA